MGHQLIGFLLPNDVHIHWTLMIVLYPYVTGLVAGAFIVSSLYHVFDREELKPLGRFALAASFCFLSVATLPLLNHLGHPERGPMVLITPNFSSAIVSGIAVLIVLYQLAMKIKGMAIERDTISALVRWLWLFMIMSLTLELLEIMTLAYEKAEEWEVIGPLLANQLSISFISVQMVLGGLIPLILLGIVVVMGAYMDDRIRNTLSMVASLLLLMQVLAMRWNVVIGGQMFSKSMRGFRDTYVPGMFEKEGILAAAVILILPFLLLVIFERILPTIDHLRPNTSDLGLDLDPEPLAG